jgi:hypothetical protein
LKMANFEAKSKDSSKCRFLWATNTTDLVFRDAYSSLLQGLNRNVELTREDVKILADHIKTRPANPPDNTARESGEIPLNPKREDYLHLKWWDPDQWQAIKNKLMERDEDDNSPVISLYMEDQFGAPIPRDIKFALRRDIYAYWNQLRATSPGELLHFGEIGLSRKEDFRKTIEATYPWLRLCSGHWKVDQLWVSYFRTWGKSRGEARSRTKESTPFSTSADHGTSPLLVGSKRRFEENEESPEESFKRRRENEKVLMAPTAFHHPRPMSNQRVRTKIAKAKVR